MYFSIEAVLLKEVMFPDDPTNDPIYHIVLLHSFFVLSSQSDLAKVQTSEC